MKPARLPYLKKDLPYLKKDHYGNCTVLSPEGTPMFRCALKKARWYLERNLATIVEGEISDSKTLIIQFTFQPKGVGRVNDGYFLSHKNNHCVVCSSEDKLTRHHVVPYCYRRFFPADTARFNSYDIVLLCIEHHHNYEQYARQLKLELAEKHDAPLNGSFKDPNTFRKYHRAESLRRTLIKYYDKIPPHHRQEMMDFVSECAEIKNITLEELKQKSFKEFPGYENRPDVYHGQMVMPHYDIDDFSIMWRQHFVNTMQPQFLPSFWVPDRRIFEERRFKNLGPRDILALKESGYKV